MSASKLDLIAKTSRLSEEVTKPFPRSKKIYIQGPQENIQVGMREVACSDTSTSFDAEENPPIPIYDTSGPLTDPNTKIDLSQVSNKLFCPIAKTVQGHRSDKGEFIPARLG